MKLEVGKSYRTRAGEKVTIINSNNDPHYPFKGDNKNCYKENGRVWRYTEDEIDLIALWEGEPATPMYKAGDKVEIEVVLGDYEAEQLNDGDDDLGIGARTKWSVVSHTPAPEPKFDWSTAKVGMAFIEKMTGRKCWYSGKSYTVGDMVVVGFDINGGKYESHFIDNLTRAPEHDMEVK